MLGLHCCAWDLSLHCGTRVSHCGGFSCYGAQALGVWASVVVALDSRTLARSCGTQAELFHSIWDLLGPRIELIAPEFAGRFFSTVPPGKS